MRKRRNLSRRNSCIKFDPIRRKPWRFSPAAVSHRIFLLTDTIIARFFCATLSEEQPRIFRRRNNESYLISGVFFSYSADIKPRKDLFRKWLKRYVTKRAHVLHLARLLDQANRFIHTYTPLSLCVKIVQMSAGKKEKTTADILHHPNEQFAC